MNQQVKFCIRLTPVLNFLVGIWCAAIGMFEFTDHPDLPSKITGILMLFLGLFNVYLAKKNVKLLTKKFD